MLKFFFYLSLLNFCLSFYSSPSFSSISSIKYFNLLKLYNHKDEILHLEPINKFTGEVFLPGSKSIANRVLLLAALSSSSSDLSSSSPHVCKLENLPPGDDVKYMVEALKQLNVNITYFPESNTAFIVGNNGVFSRDSSSLTTNLFVGNSGTSMRQLASILSICGNGSYCLDGIQRMRERPIKDLVESLKQIGCDITCSSTGCPPLYINSPPKLSTNKLLPRIRISGKISSQFITSILIASPLIKFENENIKKIAIDVIDELISEPYVDMTIKLMKLFNIKIKKIKKNNKNNITRSYIIELNQYKSPSNYFIEGDYSSASYFLTLSLLLNNKLKIYNLNKKSLQGDSYYFNIIKKYFPYIKYYYNKKKKFILIKNLLNKNNINSYSLSNIIEDCKMCPDVAMTLAVLASFCSGVSRLDNIQSWKVKETDRLEAMKNEFKKLNITSYEKINKENNTISFYIHGKNYNFINPTISLPSPFINNQTIQTYDDHRMAMAFSLYTAGKTMLNIENPSCTNKTFPQYFQIFKQLSQ